MKRWFAIFLVFLYPDSQTLAQVDKLFVLQHLAQTENNRGMPKPCVESMPGMTMCPPLNHHGNDAATGMKMGSDMDHGLLSSQPFTFIQQIMHHGSSGTTVEPTSTPTPMLMTMKGPWMLMFHANIFLTDTQQSGPRGGDKFYSTNWFMPMAQRRLGPGRLTVRAMFSLEPATISGREYPLLFQQGETAFGKPIVDGQHPHDFFMETAALYDLQFGEKTLLSFYAAPVGDPAIGPTAYPHRASASENPVASLGHHQEDSTHIASDVLTVGMTHGIARLEIGGFHGREPDEFRWNIDQGKIDSWSTRMTVQPTQNLSGQISYARIKSPEQFFPAEDQARTTASMMYNRPSATGNWSNTLLWGRTRTLSDNSKENSYLLESLLQFKMRNFAWTRIENAGRSNELVDGANPIATNFLEKPVGHVAAYTLGFDREINLSKSVKTAIGGQITTYGVPDALSPFYKSHPYGYSVFLRVRPSSNK